MSWPDAMNINMLNSKPVHSLITGQGPPVILIHGMAASVHTWNLTIPALIEAGFRVYALDLLGHGESYKPENRSDYHIQSVYQHLESWILELELDQPARIVAHSLGAHLACQFALRQPGKVSAMELLDPFLHRSQLTEPIRLTLAHPHLSARVLDLAPYWALRYLVEANPHVSKSLPPWIKEQVASDYKRADPAILFIPPSIEDLRPQLNQIRTPVQIIWGEKDLTLTPISFPELVSLFPNARGLPIPDAGHTPHLTRPAEVNRGILDFFKQPESQTS